MAVKKESGATNETFTSGGGVKYSEAVENPDFKNLMSKKRKFIAPLTVFFLLFYLALPVLILTSDVLNNSAIGPITWAWILAFAQFAMTWTLCILYVRKSAKFDKDAEAIIEEEERKAKGDHS
ncbi:Uncharacterized membrane protein, DUF485 family [Marinococcus luteus]|uniref:Uncharacterized membrane protein, DUF485 family n=1 Tax=Marinococcus luteus TaxID=1122204 RepID=A0A1H2TC58_9BACI|nr:DUF485 domain-containing protein [Marinococcus luteus]SDW41536.1 Uncharacterized membrane protein, DUF485 family [Marinococcus luteus]